VSDSVPFGHIVDRLSDFIEVEMLSDPGVSDSTVRHSDVHRPGMGLMGYVENYYKDRVQVLGLSECGYLDSLDEAQQVEAIGRILALNVPGIFVANRRELPAPVLKALRATGTPVATADIETDELIGELRDILADLLAPSETIHGTLVDVYGVGLLFVGDSGIGKSETALDLVERGHRLVADDMVLVQKRASDVLLGTRRPGIGHVLEIRGVGIVDLMPVFGVRSIRMQKRIEVVVRLEHWSDDADYDRHGLDRQETKILGVSIPEVIVPIVPGKNSTVIAEVVALDFMLRTYGIDSAQEFNRKLIETMAESGNTWRYLKHDIE